MFIGEFMTKCFYFHHSFYQKKKKKKKDYHEDNLNDKDI